jgi:FkbM family methyltransferase
MTTKVLTHPANRDRRLRQLAMAVRFQVVARITRAPVLIPIGNRSRLWASLDNGPSVLAAYARQPDYAEWNVWRRHLRPGDLFVDVGANVGIYTILAAEHGATVVSIEPHPSFVERLLRNLEVNSIQAEVHQIALDEEPGTVRFDADADARNHIQDSGMMEVRADTLDRVLGDRQVRGLKVDVEGAERRVLEGAVDALAHGRIALAQLEWNETARVNFGEDRQRVADLLGEYGYSIFRPLSDGTLVPTTVAEGGDVFAGRPERVRHLTVDA